MAAEIEKVLEPVATPLELDLAHKPHVILVVGVNGTGKTTTIGKLAAKLAARRHLDAAGRRRHLPRRGDRAAEDLGRAHRFAGHRPRDRRRRRRASPSTPWQQAKAQGADVLLIDTAGRLQNKTELMAELEKIIRVLKQARSRRRRTPCC